MTSRMSLSTKSSAFNPAKTAFKEREANLNLGGGCQGCWTKQSFENEKSALNDEIARLRESIKTSSALISNFEELATNSVMKIQLPFYWRNHEEEIKKLRDDLATRPTQEMQEAFDRLKSRTERYSWPVNDSLKKMRLSEVQHAHSQILKNAGRYFTDKQICWGGLNQWMPTTTD